MATEKQYLNGVWIRSHRFPDGNEILNLSISRDKVDEICAELKRHGAATGWARLCIAQRRNPDQKSTHSIFFDSYTPKPATRTAPTSAQTQAQNRFDDVPF